MKKLGILLLCLFSCLCLFGCEKQENKSCINTYDINIIYDNDSKSLTCDEHVTYFNNSDIPLNYICFHLYPTAFREGSNQSVITLNEYRACYYNGTSYGDIQVSKVTQNDEPIHYEICGDDQNILKVNLSQELQPQDSVEIFIEFDVQLPNINHRFGYGENTINIANFYPIACVYENGDFFTEGYNANGDPFYSEIANYNVNITYPSNLKIAHTGTEKNKTETDYQFEQDKIIKCDKVNIKAEKVRDFAFVLSEKFNIVQTKEEDTNIFYFYYKDQNPQTSLQTAVDSLKTFNKLFGKYPYETLSVVESNFVHGGMEYPNLVYISDAIADYSDYQNVIIHEIAHQWWYNLVGSNAFNNGWQDEGLTDYSTALFYEKNPSYNRSKDTMILNAVKNYSFFVDVYSSVYGKLDTSMTRPLDDYPTSPEYVYIAYVKSMLMFDSLRNLIGDEDFFKGLNLYFDTYCYKIANPHQLIECFNNVSNSNLESFFNSWLEGKVIIVSP